MVVVRRKHIHHAYKLKIKMEKTTKRRNNKEITKQKNILLWRLCVTVCVFEAVCSIHGVIYSEEFTWINTYVNQYIETLAVTTDAAQIFEQKCTQTNMKKLYYGKYQRKRMKTV